MHLCMDIDCALHPYACMDLCVCMHGYDYLDIICNVAYCILLHVMQCIVLQRSVCMRVYIYIFDMYVYGHFGMVTLTVINLNSHRCRVVRL